MSVNLLPSTAFSFYYLYSPAVYWYLLTPWKRISAGNGCFRNTGCKGLTEDVRTTGVKQAQFSFCPGPYLLAQRIVVSVSHFQGQDGLDKLIVSDELVNCNVFII